MPTPRLVEDESGVPPLDNLRRRSVVPSLRKNITLYKIRFVWSKGLPLLTLQLSSSCNSHIHLPNKPRRPAIVPADFPFSFLLSRERTSFACSSSSSSSSHRLFLVCQLLNFEIIFFLQKRREIFSSRSVESSQVDVDVVRSQTTVAERRMRRLVRLGQMLWGKGEINEYVNEIILMRR